MKSGKTLTEPQDYRRGFLHKERDPLCRRGSPMAQSACHEDAVFLFQGNLALLNLSVAMRQCEIAARAHNEVLGSLN